jgi:hypothetical protein
LSGNSNILIGGDVPVSSTSNYLNIGNIILAEMASSSVTIKGDLWANAYHGDGSQLTGIDGVFEVDLWGNLMPSITVTRDKYFEVQDGNIQPL